MNYRAALEEAEYVTGQITVEQFPVHESFSAEELSERMERYEAIAAPLVALACAPRESSEAEAADLWTECLWRLSHAPPEGRYIWVNLRLYPALQVLYAVGIASLLQERYEEFAKVLTGRKLKDYGRDKRVVIVVNSCDVLEARAARQLPGLGASKTPVSDRLYDVLREPFRDLLPDDEAYGRAFDRFEYLLALVFADFFERAEEHVWAPPGRFAWRPADGGNVMEEVEAELAKSGEAWPLLKAGLFFGEASRVRSIKSEIDAQMRSMTLP